ncbi:MAG: 3-phosphoglycerate dehydrogenase [Spirochaetaceae bacterium]|nr:MAG: 3-phosphoglycerate dehydrogenase [Spirochaetaceae bacterium]
MFTIQTLNKISPLGLAVFPADLYTVGDDVADPDAILVRSAALHDLQFGPNLKAIARAGAGVNNIPIDRCSESGIVVFNTPGANANSVKELVIAALLLSARDIQQGMQWVRDNAATPDLAKVVEKEKSRFAGTEILGKTLGVVGLGAIGVLVSNAAASLGMRVIGYDPFISVASAWDLSRQIERAQSLDHLLGQCDYVTLHVPLNDQTKNMIDAAGLAKMKQGATILNFARGGLVDEDALLASLSSGQTGRYVTDFPNEKIASHEHVLGIPHLGASTEEAEDNCAVMASRQLREYLENGTLTNSVNYPDCMLAGTAPKRIVVANRNIPNMVGQITTILAGHSINILDLLNRHRGDLAYNIIDIEGDLPPGAIEQLNAIDGVIFVRTIPTL